MVAWWPGDLNYSDIVGGNNGTPSGGVKFAGGKVARAFSFDGTGVVQVQPPSLDPTNIIGDLTIEAWINPASSNRGDIVVHGNGDDVDDAYTFRYGDGNDQKLLVSVSDGDTAESDFETYPNAIQNPGKWNHVAVTIQGTTATIYVNGAAVPGYYSLCPRGSCMPATQLTANRFSDNGVLSFGNRADANSNLPYTGFIDEVSIYNRALSASEILALYNAGSAGKCKGGLAVDVSGLSTTTYPWSNMCQAGISYAVVETFRGVTSNTNASSQLLAAQGAGLGTAAYLELNLTPAGLAAQSGAHQAQKALNLLSSISTSSLAFMGIAVEYLPSCERPPTTKPIQCYPQDAGSVAARTNAISQAIQTIKNGGSSNQPIPNVVIYTLNGPKTCPPSEPYCHWWQILTGTSFNPGVPLWDSVNENTATINPNLAFNCSVSSTDPAQCRKFSGYSPWTSRVGEQFLNDDTATFGVLVDFDLFETALFTSVPGSTCPHQ